MVEISKTVGVLGATSFVGKSLLPMLSGAGFDVHAFSRQHTSYADPNITWRQATTNTTATSESNNIGSWVCVAPVWVLPEYLPWLKSMGATRVVALSSTSLFTKTKSNDSSEQLLAKHIAQSEKKFIEWAQLNNIEWVILRPTLIYGLGLDKNISEIAHFIRRFSFFPLFGKAYGLRQPVHVQDVAQACFASLKSTTPNRAYNLSGGEAVSYREMVARLFARLGYPVRFFSIPIPVFRIAVAVITLLPRYRKWTFAMAERMNQDMVFDHTDAKNDLGFNPRNYNLQQTDLPI